MTDKTKYKLGFAIAGKAQKPKTVTGTPGVDRAMDKFFGRDKAGPNEIILVTEDRKKVKDGGYCTTYDGIFHLPSRTAVAVPLDIWNAWDKKRRS